MVLISGSIQANPGQAHDVSSCAEISLRQMVTADEIGRVDVLDSSSVRELRREIDIDAPLSAVWAVLTNTGSYPEWNPFIRRLSGDLREGAKLEVRIEPPGGRAMSFKPTVLSVENERELRWLGRFLFRGLFDGEHIFRLEARGDGGTRFTQAERFSGILVRAFGNMLDKTELGFEQMNTALKARAEDR